MLKFFSIGISEALTLRASALQRSISRANAARACRQGPQDRQVVLGMYGTEVASERYHASKRYCMFRSELELLIRVSAEVFLLFVHLVYPVGANS